MQIVKNQITAGDVKKMLENLPDDHQLVFHLHGQLAKIDGTWELRDDNMGYYFINLEGINAWTTPR